MRRAFVFFALLALVATRPSGDDKSKSEEKDRNSTDVPDDAMSHLIRKRGVDEELEHADNETKVEEHEEPKVVPIESARKKREDVNSMFNPTTPTGFLSNLQNGANSAWNAAQPGIQQMGQGIQGAAENAWSSMQQGANSAVQGVQNLGNQLDQAAGNFFGQPSTPNAFLVNNAMNMNGQPSTPNMFPMNNGMSQSTVAPYYQGVTVPGSQPEGFFQKAGNWFKNIFSG